MWEFSWSYSAKWGIDHSASTFQTFKCRAVGKERLGGGVVIQGLSKENICGSRLPPRSLPPCFRRPCNEFTILTFPACFSIPIFFSNLNYDCSILLDIKNLQEQVKKAFCYWKLFWPFSVWINCSSHLKNFANSQPSALNFKSFSRSLEIFFLTARSEQFW